MCYGPVFVRLSVTSSVTSDVLRDPAVGGDIWQAPKDVSVRYVLIHTSL